jgi:hypothetical protein
LCSLINDETCFFLLYFFDIERWSLHPSVARTIIINYNSDCILKCFYLEIYFLFLKFIFYINIIIYITAKMTPAKKKLYIFLKQCFQQNNKHILSTIIYNSWNETRAPSKQINWEMSWMFPGLALHFLTF